MQQGLFEKGSMFSSKAKGRKGNSQEKFSSFPGSLVDTNSAAELNFSSEEKVISSQIFEELTNDVILGLCFEVHRELKLNYLFLDETTVKDEDTFEIVDVPGLDVFGQVDKKKQAECVCPVCKITMASCRFTMHLEKCLGRGRNSQRIANQKIEKNLNTESDIEDCDNDRDGDWNGSSESKSKKKRDKNSKRGCKLKGKRDQRKIVLMQVCGVVSENSKKITRSLRCPQASDEPKQPAKSSIVEQNYMLDSTDDVHVDVDTVEEEPNSMRLWESSDFADVNDIESSSTSNGSSSKKRDRKGILVKSLVPNPNQPPLPPPPVPTFSEPPSKQQKKRVV